MLHKKILSLLCAALMLFSLPFAQAEEADATGASFASFVKRSDTMYYRGSGAVMRGFVKGADVSSAQLELSYVMTSAPYIVLGQLTTWEVTVTGGQGPYLVQAILAYQNDLDMDEFADPWQTLDSFTLDSSSFEYTFENEGRYFWEFRIFDENGQYLSYQSEDFSIKTRIYEGYTPEDETDEETVVGKVNSIVSELITEDMSDYTRALKLHDWLIYNANYDTTYTNYDASGVLLKGTGVCDSYGRAYLMLCTAAGVECIYISGIAGDDPDQSNWENHGWNMVKLNGSWYHVDCTWDDPVTQSGNGGAENHKYFCVDDETLAKDHRWNRPDDIFDNGGFIAPEANGGEFSETDEADPVYHFTFSSYEDFSSGIDKLAAAGYFYATTKVKYVGDAASKPSWATWQEWCVTKGQALANAGLISGKMGMSYDGVDLYSVSFPWKDFSKYIRIDETSVFLSIGETVTIYASDYYPQANRFTWKSSDTRVAKVSGGYSSDKGPYVKITAVSDGEATITASVSGGESDRLTVTVLPALTPDFDLGLTEADEGVTLAWAAIPGATEYRIMRILNGKETQLGTTCGTEYFLTDAQLSSNVNQQLYIVGLRIVGDKTVASYTSNPLTYGKDIPTLTYAATLPAAVTAIDAEAFYGDVSLTSFKVPAKVTTIGDRAFSGCTSLTVICIPQSVTSIGADAFASCPLEYAEVVKGSYAAQWLAENCPDVQLVY